MAIRTPDEGCDVTTLEVGEDQKQMVEKVLVRLHDVETEFSSQGACVVISQDKDCKHIIAVFFSFSSQLRLLPRTLAQLMLLVKEMSTLLAATNLMVMKMY